MKYSIIIPAHNSRSTLERCIKSIIESRFNEPIELMVVDDASSDDTPAIAKRLGAKVISNKECKGPGFARNLGAKFAEGSILLFIDSDILLCEDTLQKIDNFFREKNDFAAISCNFDPKCEMSDPISRYKHLYICYSFLNQSPEVLWTFTSCLAIQKDIFQRVGGFNEKILVLEDELLGREISKNGFRIYFAEKILVKHLRKYSIFDFFKEEIRRSRALILIRYFDFFKRIKHQQDNVAKNIQYSIFLFPFFVTSIFLVKVNPLLLILSVMIYYLINYNFLIYCKKQFGLKFMLQAALIIPGDCLLCWCGIIAGSFDLLGGKKI